MRSDRTHVDTHVEMKSDRGLRATTRATKLGVSFVG
jgi:hypothetical protein